MTASESLEISAAAAREGADAAQEAWDRIASIDATIEIAINAINGLLGTNQSGGMSPIIEHANKAAEDAEEAASTLKGAAEDIKALAGSAPALEDLSKSSSNLADKAK